MPPRKGRQAAKQAAAAPAAPEPEPMDVDEPEAGPSGRPAATAAGAPSSTSRRVGRRVEFDERRLSHVELSGTPASTSCIRWSNYASAAIVAHNIIHVVTPTFGSSDILAKPNLKLAGNEQVTPLNHAYYTSLTLDTLPPVTESVLIKAEWYKDYGLGHTGLAAVRWRDAAWSPEPLGAQHSPLLATLTSRLDLHLYEAGQDAFCGTFKYLEQLKVDMEKEDRLAILNSQIACFTWLPARPPGHEGDVPSGLLLAATRGGQLIVWERTKFESKAVLCQQEQIISAGISQIALTDWSVDSEGEGCSIRIALISPGQVHSATLSLNNDSTNITLDPIDPLKLAEGVSKACWGAKSVLYLGVPGAVRRWEPDNEGKSSIALLGEVEGEALGSYLSPAVSIDPIKDDAVLVTLAHGIHYQLFDSSFEEEEEDAVAVAPSSLLAPHHAGGLENAMNKLHLKHELAQGLWAFERGNGAGSAFVGVVHRADELGQWAIKTEQRARLNFTWMLLAPLSVDSVAISLCKAALADTDANRTSAARFAPLVSYYYAEGQTQEVIESLLVDAEEAVASLEAESSEDTQSDVVLRSRIWLLQWIEMQTLTEDRRGRAAAARAAFSKSLVKISTERRIEAAAALTEDSQDDEDLGHSYCVRLVASALIATGDVSDTLSTLLKYVKGDESDATIKGWKRDLKAGNGIDVGETCPACDKTLRLNSERSDQVVCPDRHIWVRCSITLGVLGGSKPRTCISCGLKALADSQGDVSQLEEKALRQAHCCWMCGGSWIVL